MKKLVVANWKMYQETSQDASRLLSSIKRRIKHARADVVVCVPSIFLQAAGKALRGSNLVAGAQDVSRFGEGAYTGEVSARMLKAAGATHVIVGHSERRSMGEDEATIAEKLLRTLEEKLIPILCVGEKTRDSSGRHFAVIEAQLRSALGRGGKKLPVLVIAYEPVFAIGKGADAALKPMELQETAIFIRKTVASLFGRTGGLSVPILYGGSVEAANARGLMKEGGIQGFMVGHASTNPVEFAEIVQHVSA